MGEKDIEAGYENAPQTEEGRSPTSEKTLISPGSSPQIPSRCNTSGATTAASIAPVKRSHSLRSILPQTSKAKAAYKVQKLEDYALGYPRTSCFMNSDISFSLFRRFGILHTRLILHKQDQIRELEEELNRLDLEDQADEDREIALRCREEADYLDPPEHGGKSRQELLSQIEKLLLEYGTLMEQAHKFESMEKPTARDHFSVTNYYDMFGPVVQSDRDFLLYKDDLVTTRAGRDHAWLDAAVESLLRWYPCEAVKYMFCDAATREKTTEERIHYFTRTRINFFVTLIITILIMVLLVIPIGILFYLSLNDTSGSGEILIIGVLMICTLVFSCVLSLFTKAKRHELLAASAGYCAVLVVFVGNVGSNASRSS